MKKISIACIVLPIVSFLMGMALAGTLPDTGQTKCYDANGNEINPCPSPGQDFYGQDANYALCNPHSYTKLDGNGNPLSDDAPSWVMVRDNVTGLIWENKTDDGSIHDKDNIYTWHDAQAVFTSSLNNDNFGGHSDWRLPTVKELSSIVDSSIPWPDPTINTIYFPNTQLSHYWSSTNLAYNPNYAWFVYFGSGYVSTYNKSGYYYVRAVRGGQCGSFGDYTDNGDGTVTNTKTGLMWQKDTAPGTYNWQHALTYCENLPLAGYNDWRLPNRNELQSIVDYDRYNPSIDPIFSNTVSSFYWSSTTYATTPNYAWIVRFSYGYVYDSDKSSNHYVRAVRGGQCGSCGDLDGEGILDDGDNSGTPGDNPCTGGQTTQCDDNCPNNSNPGQEDADSDEVGDACDNCPNAPNPGQDDLDHDCAGDLCDNCPFDSANDIDHDGICGDVDNCLTKPNGRALGTCVKIVSGVVIGTGVNCTGYEDCEEDEYCQMEQGDCNDNGVGDVCECYANFNYPTDFKVNVSDLGVFKREYGRINCNTTPPPCEADGNNDGKVNAQDLGLFKNEYGRIDCPLLP